MHHLKIALPLLATLASPLALAEQGQNCDSHKAYLAGRLGKSIQMQCAPQQLAEVKAAFAKGQLRAEQNHYQNARFSNLQQTLRWQRSYIMNSGNKGQRNDKVDKALGWQITAMHDGTLAIKAAKPQ
ncbi:hypothetical protein [Gallaecimonas mangrovi]|uniref:hypothetical protein n=1 Tax=Gallaecimonas mangrovi TaxID=2291597 RepID=UPI000E20AE8A|nr:hypothetical protein [Gallaecimonas mangrovi]